MFGNGLFALGMLGPLLLLFLGHAAIGLLFSAAAIVARLRAGSGAGAAGPQRTIDCAIASLAASVLLTVLGAALLHLDSNLGIMLFAAGLLLAWPVSAVLTLLGRGAGWKPLLVGQALIALLLSGFLVCLWVFNLR
jgi:hypothetical protein